MQRKGSEDFNSGLSFVRSSEEPANSQPLPVRAAEERKRVNVKSVYVLISCNLLRNLLLTGIGTFVIILNAPLEKRRVNIAINTRLWAFGEVSKWS